MTRLRDFGWWPDAWSAERGGSALTAAEIRKGGVLKNARRVPGGLTLVVDHNGVSYAANVGAHLSEDFLILLRHILLQHWGEAVEAVENVDFNFGILK